MSRNSGSRSLLPPESSTCHQSLLPVHCRYNSKLVVIRVLRIKRLRELAVRLSIMGIRHQNITRGRLVECLQPMTKAGLRRSKIQI